MGEGKGQSVGLCPEAGRLSLPSACPLSECCVN